MVYYKVKPEYDNFRLIHNRKDIGILVGDELYTERELVRKNILLALGVKPEFFEMVEIPKSRVYHLFGARFAY